MAYTHCVWYRVTDDRPDMQTVLRSMMARLSRTGITGQLMKKCDEPRLWMEEVYQGIADAEAFELRLAQVADEYDVDMFVADTRRVECFQIQAAKLPACADPS